MLYDARTKARVIELRRPTPHGAIAHARTMAPTVILNVTDDMNVMKDEIFGPILPYRDLEDAVAYINSQPRPLALYFFGPDGPGRRMVLERTTSGDVSINETILHYAQNDIPFGGVRASGMGAYHGHEGFKTLSHAMGVFEQAKFSLTDTVRPPFGRIVERVIALMMR
jgi:coniferyl-aldehyde dehydrogenase